MDGWTKTMIIGACAVIIIGGGYYGWSEYQRISAAAERQAGVDRARKEIFQLASAEDGDLERVRQFCKAANTLAESQFKDDDYAQNIARNCRAFGYSN